MRVSFDFDDTIRMTRWDDEEEVFVPAEINKSTISKMKKHLLNGDTVFIITSRKWSEDSEKEIKDTLISAGIPLGGIEEIIHVGDWKASTLVKNKIEMHYDDDPYEISKIPEEIKVVKIETLHGME